MIMEKAFLDDIDVWYDNAFMSDGDVIFSSRLSPSTKPDERDMSQYPEDAFTRKVDAEKEFSWKVKEYIQMWYREARQLSFDGVKKDVIRVRDELERMEESGRIEESRSKRRNKNTRK